MSTTPAPALTAIRPRAGFASALAILLLVVVMMGGTVSTPLFPIYAKADGLTPITITTVFAVYAVGILVTLLGFGRISDSVGRLPIIVLGVALAAVGMVIPILSSQLPALLIARLLTGVSVGFTTGATTAYLGELHGNRARAALVAGIANMAGLGLGALLGGVTAQLSDAPLRLPYALMIVLMLPVAVIGLLPETVPDRSAWSFRPQRPSIPESAMGVFVPAAAGVFTAFSVLGLTAGLAGSFLAGSLHSTNHILAGGAILLSFGAAALAQPITVRTDIRTGLIAGSILLPIGAVLFATALNTASLPIFLIGTTIGGAGAGTAFRAGLSAVTVAAPPTRVGEVASAYFAAAYLGLTMPVVGVGALAIWVPLSTAAIVFAIVVLVLATAVVIGANRRHSEPNCENQP
ncbi:MFS transporter [Nocardia pseudobrasiliensis]|uniref:Putative MFS family arabinose efflux permease n=1 Tax=Nocardia pseudobrasiliensis TaxID=45979 RepID=A0A370I492_9NOCA|nr:MFS transporter [Nocardia pseudobrasiliensis]RDI65552.1 putative MFS family arabinose efflux permease [Nocardia pseudobrasiliensis]